MARNCPECSIEMNVEFVGDVPLDICPGCAGTWFDANELRTLLARDPLALGVVEDMAVPAIQKEAAGETWRRCPDCQMPLEQFHYLYHSKVVLDTCPDCGGVWVQDGELTAIQEWMHAADKPASAREEAGLAIAQATITHDQSMQRQQKVLGIFNLLRLHRPTGLTW